MPVLWVEKLMVLVVVVVVCLLMPNNPEQVAEAIEKAGGEAYIVQKDEGTRIN